MCCVHTHTEEAPGDGIIEGSGAHGHDARGRQDELRLGQNACQDGEGRDRHGGAHLWLVGWLVISTGKASVRVAFV